MFLYVKNAYNPDPGYQLMPELQAAGAPDGGGAERRLLPYLDAPLMLLPRTDDDLKALRTAKFWRKRSYEERLFEKNVGEFTFATLTDPESLQTWLPKAHELFLERWDGEHTGSEWATAEGFAPFHDAMLDLAPQGLASLSVLYLNDEQRLLAYGYSLEQDRTRYLYQHSASLDPAFRKAGVGTIFLTRLLRESVADSRFDQFDFMVGNLPYKLAWATTIQRVWEVFDSSRYANRRAWYIAMAKARAAQMVRERPGLRLAAKAVLRRLRPTRANPA